MSEKKGVLYKYRNFGDRTNDIILHSKLYFSSIKGFNDPFDCRLRYRQDYSQEEIEEYCKKHSLSYDSCKGKLGTNKLFVEHSERVNNRVIESIGVLSLSSNPNSILMWSHYAKNHTGLVFQFTVIEDDDWSECFTRPIKVDYADEYEFLSFTGDNRKELPKLMLTKMAGWSYESEYRVIDLNYQGEKEFKKVELTTIIFGARANDVDISNFIRLCEDNGFQHVKFSKAILSKENNFSLDFQKINKEDWLV